MDKQTPPDGIHRGHHNLAERRIRRDGRAVNLILPRDPRGRRDVPLEIVNGGAKLDGFLAVVGGLGLARAGRRRRGGGDVSRGDILRQNVLLTAGTGVTFIQDHLVSFYFPFIGSIRGVRTLLVQYSLYE